LREKASLYGLIEFMRAVHAEMAAISSAARRGIGINGCTIFSTTFPCHECARHIVAAGLTKAVFIDPYPKSRVGEMFDDSIAVDEEDGKRIPFLPYVGVSPRMYLQLFRAPKRRNPDGTLVNWEAIRRTQSPRLARSDYGYIEVEAESMDVFNQLLKSRLPGATKSGGHNG